VPPEISGLQFSYARADLHGGRFAEDAVSVSCARAD
jgi:hypothetical protein